MTLLASLPRIEEHRVSVVFDCPKCQTNSVQGTAYNLRETLRLNRSIPLWGWTSHWVRCSECHAELSADVEPRKLRGASQNTVNDSVHAYLALPKRFLAITAMTFSWAPVVGMLVAIAAMAANLRTRGWPRVVSIFAIILTSLLNAAYFGTVAYWSYQAARPLANAYLPDVAG